jgi:hypothetical protein
VDWKDVPRLPLWSAADLLESRAQHLEEAVEGLLRLPHVGDHIAGTLARCDVELASPWLSWPAASSAAMT